ncbi:MAG: hypothetical protein B7733_11600 [Myxococcales bacterium FL481]|nr:MAG: hypothetical protein B7733_12195 [Myxococcales bacterium FL481]TPV95122.1 MAG: hypothetical protein B7733_11600 [Myxococcales bacterium FL481]
MPSAESPSPEVVSRELAHELMSPYCPGRTVASCTSGQARLLEDEIREQVAAGKSREQIKEALIARFGEETLGSSTNPTVVYGTLLLALVGAVVGAFFVRRWRASGDRASASPRGWAQEHAVATSVSPSAVELDRLEDELDRVEDF